ncbi:hypothetical protein H5410_021734, partial [Solanum commersonii]
NFLIFRYNARAHFDVTICDQKKEEYIPVYFQTNANYYIVLGYLFQEISEGSEEHEQQPTIGTDQEVGKAYSRSEEVGQKNSSRHNFVNLNGDSPYYEITISIRFSLRTSIVNMKNMRLFNEEGIEWGVEIEYNGHMVIIKRGWSEFLKDNKIASDETYRFKLIRGHVANVLHIYIYLLLKDRQTCNSFAKVLNFRYLHKLSSYNYKYMYSASALREKLYLLTIKIRTMNTFHEDLNPPTPSDKG